MIGEPEREQSFVSEHYGLHADETRVFAGDEGRLLQIDPRTGFRVALLDRFPGY